MKGHSTYRKLTPKGARLQWKSIREAKTEQVDIFARNIKKGKQLIADLSAKDSTKPASKMLVP